MFEIYMLKKPNELETHAIPFVSLYACHICGQCCDINFRNALLFLFLFFCFIFFLLSWRTALRGIESITLLSLIHAPAFGCGYELKQRN